MDRHIPASTTHHDKLTQARERRAALHILFILNDPPYGTERGYNALRLAHALLKASSDHRVEAFLMGDAVLSAKAGQETPQGFYNMERMLRRVVTGDRGRVRLCGTCLDARGIADDELMDGPTRSTMIELAQATAEADRVLVF